MSVTSSNSYSNLAFFRGGTPYMKDAETLAQDATRATAFANKTVVYQDPDTRKWAPLTDVAAALSPAILTCGALGSSLATFQGITDGEFAIPIGGVTVDVTGLDFSDIDAPTDTPAYLTCGTNGAAIGSGWDALTAGEFAITVNGVSHDVTGIDYTDATTFDEVVEITNNAIAALGIRCVYDYDSNKFRFVTIEVGRDISIGYLAAVSGGSGTDISGSGYFNGLTGTGVITAGTGGLGASITSVINAAAAGKFTVEWDASANALIFVAPDGQSISYLAAVSGGSGTDVSGASYLNGLTGTGVITVEAGYQIPMGIALMSATAAEMVAADVTGFHILVGGMGLQVDEDQVVLENSLALTDVVHATGKTIEATLREIGIFTISTVDISS